MRQYANEDAADANLQSDVARAWRSDDAIGDTFSYLRRHGGRGMQFVSDELTGGLVRTDGQSGRLAAGRGNAGLGRQINAYSRILRGTVTTLPSTEWASPYKEECRARMQR